MSNIPPPRVRFIRTSVAFSGTLTSIAKAYQEAGKVNIPKVLMDNFYYYFASDLAYGQPKEETDPEFKQKLNTNRKAALESFITNSHPHWGKIWRKEEDFITKEFAASMFPKAAPVLDQLMPLLNDTDPVTIENKKMIWDYLQKLVKMCIAHVFQVTLCNSKGERQTMFDYHPNIDIPSICKMYAIDMSKVL